MKLIEEVLKKDPNYSFAERLNYCSDHDIKHFRDLMKDFLYKDTFGGKDIFKINGNESIISTAYIILLDKLLIIWLTDPKNTKDIRDICPYAYEYIADMLFEETDSEGLERYIASVRHDTFLLEIILAKLFQEKDFDIVIKTLESIDDVERVNNVRKYIINDCLKRSEWAASDCINDIPLFEARLNTLYILRNVKNEL